jgi:hypothetical protein
MVEDGRKRFIILPLEKRGKNRPLQKRIGSKVKNGRCGALGSRPFQVKVFSPPGDDRTRMILLYPKPNFYVWGELGIIAVSS